MRLRLAITFCSLLLLGLVGACSDRPADSRQDPRSLMPADPAIAALYQRSCYACHVNFGGKAPLTGDKAAWEPKMAQGMDQLLSHVIDGFGAMPPLGMCMDCNADDFEALIIFMATAEHPAQKVPQQ